MEEKLDIVVDPTSAKRGIDVLITMMSKLTGSMNTAQSATTTLFNAMNRGINRLESAFLSFRSILLGFGAVITVFRQLGDQFTRFQAFTSALSVSVGGTQAARKEYEFLIGMADRLGISITSLSHNYAQLSAATASTGMSTADLRTIFESFSTAARVLHLSGQDTRLMFYALTQMVSKGTVSMEELRRQLGEKLPGAMNIAAASVGVEMQVLEAAIRKGAVDASKFLPIFAEAVKQTFEGGLPNAMRAFDAEVNRMINNIQKIIIVMMDMGVAESFTNIIKELNRVISDPKIAAEFAKGVKDISEGVTTFLRSISGDSVRAFIEQFVGGVASIGDAITNKLLPFLREMATLMKEILIAWATIKGAQLGAALGGKSGKGTAIGGAAGGLTGFLAALAAADAVDMKMRELGNKRVVTGKLPEGLFKPQPFMDDLERDLANVPDFRTVKPKARLEDVLFDGGGKDKEAEKQLKAYQSAMLSLQKVEAEGNKFTQTFMDIQAGKYSKLTQQQHQALLKAAAYAEQLRSMNDFEKQVQADKEAMGQIGVDKSQQETKAYNNLEQLRESMLSEEELLYLKFERELAIVTEAERLKVGNQQMWNETRLFIEEQFYNQMEALRKRKMTDAQKFLAMSYKDQAKTVFGELAALTAGVAQHNKAMFQINKVAGIANAVIAAHEGASKSLAAYPWPLAGIMAGLHYAAGVARVHAIASTSFNGGGVGAAPSIGGSTAAPPVSPVDSSFPGQDLRGGEQLIVIQGVNPSDIFTGQQLRDLLIKIHEEDSDGMRKRVVFG